MRRGRVFRALATLLFSLSLWCGQAMAHSDEYFDSKPAPHGGRVRMAGPLHLEVLANDSEVRLYVTDHLEQPLATLGGRAMLRVSGTERAVALAPAGDNLFTARLEESLPPDAEWVVFVEMKDTPAQSARYGARKTAPAAAEGDPHAGHHH
ncbi:MAG: hypothetical protein FJ164_06610 [Gammaproteobacteria bacterium]|nr:hypothetical protein [Gammaproteobacteria bacterium]